MNESLSTIDYDKYCTECLPETHEACRKYPQKRLVFVGNPTPLNCEKTKEEELPEMVTPVFKTIVNDTEWPGPAT